MPSKKTDSKKTGPNKTGSEKLNQMKSIAVLGGGAWGSALASTLAMAGHDLRVWARNPDTVEALQNGVSPALNQAITPPTLATTDSAKALDGADTVLVVVPSAATDDALAIIAKHVPTDRVIILTAKGLMKDDGALIHHHSGAVISNPVVVLSGPSFADEIAAAKPASLVAASDDANAAKMAKTLFQATNIRVYTSDDPTGVAVGGAVKNVIAIASGIVAGMGLGDNARAAVITRGLAEAMRFANALGSRRETLFGLAGLGDMVLTCGSVHSRNFAFGFALASNEALPENLTEGRYSASIIARRARSLGVEMPITESVARVLEDKSKIKDEVTRLLQRPVDSEWD